MTTDRPQSKPRGDQLSTDFFADVLTSYLEDDRIESGVLRLELDDGRTRRLVIDDDTEALAPYEYVRRELAEVIYLLEENEALLDEPVGVSIPVEDADRVIEEATEEEAVTTLFHTEGVKTILEHLLAVLDERDPAFEETSPDE
jgi:hypothetical protein